MDVVASVPDRFNCTAEVHWNGKGLPDVAAWEKEFKNMVGKVYTFRGVEVTVEGTIVQQKGKFFVQVPGIKDRIALAQLGTKLQWHFKKSAPRQPEADEQGAYRQLTDRLMKAKDGRFTVEVTGPLRMSDGGPVLEVREFFVLK